MRIPKLFKNQRGDTIVEVLIVVAVLSLILVVCFTLSNRSTQGTRQAQERTEAFKQTESQMERLKTYIARSESPTLPASGSDFCMKSDGTPTGVISGIPALAQQDTFAAYGAGEALTNCKKGEFYYSYIHREGNTYTAHTRWYKVGGKGIDEATMVHRIYPDLASGAGNGSTTLPTCPANFGLNNANGCTPCPNGYSSLGGQVKIETCQPMPPRIVVKVYRVANGPNNTTPNCDGALQNRAATRVNLNRANYGVSKDTDPGSQAEFINLAYNPSGPAYTASVSLPTGYKMCEPETAQVTIPEPGLGGAPGQRITGTATLKMRPICGPEKRWTTPYHHYSEPYRHYSAPYDHFVPDGYWIHQSGGNEGRHGDYPRENFKVYEGSVLVEYRFRQDLERPGLAPFHERWVYVPYQKFIGNYADDLGVYPDYWGYYSDEYYVNVCPQ